MASTFSIVVPVYQNAANLPETIPQLLRLADQIGEMELELVFVDDGSTDNSLDIIQKASVHDDRVRWIKLTRNFGQIAAIQAGLVHARGDCVGIISCDLQEPHERFIDMLAMWRAGAKFVVGERTDREEPGLHRFFSNMYWRLVRSDGLPDFPQKGYDFCLLDKEMVKEANRLSEKNHNIFILLWWLGYRPNRVPITRRLRTKGKSQWRLRGKIRLTIDTLIGFTSLPLRLITVLGLLSSLLCISYLVFIMILWLKTETAPRGWMTVIGLISLLGAFNMSALAIICEYLKRILDESRSRPPFVVDARSMKNYEHTPDEGH